MPGSSRATTCLLPTSSPAVDTMEPRIDTSLKRKPRVSSVQVDHPKMPPNPGPGGRRHPTRHTGGSPRASHHSNHVSRTLTATRAQDATAELPPSHDNWLRHKPRPVASNATSNRNPDDSRETSNRVSMRPGCSTRFQQYTLVQEPKTKMNEECIKIHCFVSWTYVHERRGRGLQLNILHVKSPYLRPPLGIV